jgi:hypothetical protein
MPVFNNVTSKWTIDDLVALEALQPLATRFVTWTSWSMRPAAVASVAIELELRRRRTVVELGSGTSTLFFARILRGTGGRLVSFEHDPEWAAYLSRLLREEQLDDVARVELVDLVPPGWYDADRLLARCPCGVDLLIVDGPPGSQDAAVLAREPAARVLKPKLAADFTIFLDDADRPAEQEIARRWEAELGIEMTIVERLALAVGGTRAEISPTL